MPVLVDRIRVKSLEQRDEFVRWVQQVDYLACRALPSVRRFQVFACPGGDGLDFFEIVEVDSLEAFEADTRTPVFRQLVDRFTEMAELGDQFCGQRVEPGYERPA